MTVVSLPPVSVIVDQLPVNTPQAPLLRPIESRSTVKLDALGPEPPVSVTVPSDTGTESEV